MLGWAFAVSLVLAVLAFELVVFRYLTTGGTTAESRAAGEPAKQGAAPDAASAGPRPDSESGGPTRRCPKCGTANDAAPGIHFCRHCLGRIR